MSFNIIEFQNDYPCLFNDCVVATYHDVFCKFCDSNDIPTFAKGTHHGTLFLSNRSIIFITKGTGFRSISMTLGSIKNIEFKQPIFGPNYIKGDIISEQGGGWNGFMTFKLTFDEGNSYHFYRNLMEVHKKFFAEQVTNFIPEPTIRTTNEFCLYQPSVPLPPSYSADYVNVTLISSHNNVQQPQYTTTTNEFPPLPIINPNQINQVPPPSYSMTYNK